jgi:hypothetical protein
MIGISQDDIERKETFFAVPGTLYSEPGVASETHPTGGSIGVWIYTRRGQIASIQDIIYYEFNTNKTHFNGLAHWNHERRLIRVDGKMEVQKNVENHIIADSESIEISFGEQTKMVRRQL